MSTDRSRPRRVGNTKQSPASGSSSSGIQLAPGVRLDGGEGERNPPVLILPSGNVQLNGGAAAILRLCDGSRGREDIIAEIMRHSPTGAMADDIIEFLEVAKARGWIVEP
jgi:pyrroloquinoline quinone biosynthesis protein D